jgi:phage tail sheath protein FI
MPTYLTPGVYVEERSSGARPIAGVSTSTAAFVGVAERGPIGRATFVTSFAEFVRRFGGPLLITPNVSEHYLYYAVRHFFEHGGTRCYVVRTAHYNVPSDATTVQAFAATRSFNGTRVNAADGALSTVTNALRIEASSRGTWGQRLTVTVRPTSKFQLSLVGPNIAAGDLTSITIEDNDVVVPGTILHLVHEITGVVATVTPGATPTFTFTSDDLMEGGASSTATIPVGAVVFKPDFSFVSALAGSQIVLTPISTANPPTGQIQLGTVDGLLPGDPGLAPGDTIHFVVTQSIVEVKATERTMVGTTRAMRVILTSADTPSQDLQAFTTNATRVYARDFSVTVSLGNDVLETHPNLSLVANHPTDYVNDRLGEDTGGSQFIAASELSTDTTAQLVTTAGRGQLTGAATDDGLANLSPADFEGSDLAKNGLHALDAVEDASILVIAYSRMVTTAVPSPRDNQRNLTNAAISWVERRRDMVYVVDPPRTPATTPVDDVVTFKGTLSSSYAALYFPWIEATEDLSGRNIFMPAAGAIAGIYARSDGNRGVHKAPAGLDVGRLSSATGMAYQVTRGDNDRVYPLNINAIRNTPEGIVVWGSRTMSADALWQQVSIRRLFIFLERSIQLGTNWVVFEPNDLTLWKTIEKTVRGFLRVQWREGKLVGATEDQAFFVRCNEETNPPEVVDAGMVVTEIGVAPSRPAEFVIFRVFQFAGRES